jgi:hydrogenase expression/formation protein HypC
MCLAIPVRVISIDGSEAIVESGGITYKTSIVLVPDVRVGDFVLLHTGYAISIIDKDEAEERLEIFREMNQLSENESH